MQNDNGEGVAVEYVRERSHMTSAAEGGGGFEMLTRGEGV